MLRTLIKSENGFELTKKSRRYLAKTITDADYANDIAILANTPNQAETPLHSLEWVTAGIGLHVNAHKMEYMCYKSNRRHLHTRRNLSETGRQIHLPRKQCLINWRGHRHMANEGMNSYRSYGNQTWPIKWNAVSSRQRSYRYYCMDALLGR